MNRFTRQIPRVLLACLLIAGMLVALPALPAYAQDAEGEAGGATDSALVSEGQISWQTQPNYDYREALLSISGPDGEVVQRRFEPGAIAMGPVNAEGALLADGQYTYQILYVPRLSAEAEAAYAEAAESHDPAVAEALVTAGLLPADVLELSGSFAISNGKFLVPALPEQVTRDQVILDDLIVDGSICAGMDCVNGESFGFDTIRLKENNLRIRAVDTSSTSSFPSRDWQITFNDSSNGGQNKFSIDDIDGGRTPFTLEAGAPSHSLYVDDGGRIGSGTSTPVVDFHIKTGNTPTVRLEQDGSSGFTPQTWDMASNEANFFIRDATNGSTLPFRIFPGAPSNALTIEASTGDIGMGTTSPGAALHVQDNDAAFRQMFHLENLGAGGIAYRMTSNGLAIDTNNTAGEYRINFDDGDNQELSLDADGNLSIDGTITTVGGSCGSGCAAARSALNAADGQALAKVAGLATVSWEATRSIDVQSAENGETQQVSVRHLSPSVEEFNAIFGLGPAGVNSIAPLDVASVAILAIQDLNQVVADQNAVIQSQQGQIAALEARLAAIESSLTQVQVDTK